ncbi:hypothetical protein C2845_PM09G21780 [Panicum miliaceum]|uniref:DUF1618 domain-containing protein n=1 Tax=Panicum miliaceum TaxID=4540 RepID=A0A3L6S0P0_PANMI|nr:hypothetical protein C2845_PM09G21780 [Panicum miliaceum]
MQKEVVLFLPVDDNDRRPPTYSSFRADMVLAVSTTSLCWVDLRTGILICDNIDMLAAGTTEDALVFRFIPLPDECAMTPNPLYWSRLAEEYRTMSCLYPETIKFVCMDSYTQDHPLEKSMLTTWTLHSPLTEHWHWCKETTVCLGDLLDDLPILKDNMRLLVPSRPVISMDRSIVVTHLIVTGFESKHDQGQWEATALYKLSIDSNGATVLEIPSAGSQVLPYSQIFSCYIQEVLTLSIYSALF